MIPSSTERLSFFEKQSTAGINNNDLVAFITHASNLITASEIVKMSHYSLQMVPYWNRYFEDESIHTFDDAIAQLPFQVL